MGRVPCLCQLPHREAENPQVAGEPLNGILPCVATPLFVRRAMYKRDRYPKNWDELSRQCKELANWRCERCNIKHGSWRQSKRTGNRYKVYLHAAHMKLHDTNNPAPELQALCPSCHGKLDFKLRMRECETRI